MVRPEDLASNHASVEEKQMEIAVIIVGIIALIALCVASAAYRKASHAESKANKAKRAADAGSPVYGRSRKGRLPW